MQDQDHEQQNSKRGFAAMSPERQREIASKGGIAAHRQGTAHQWSKEEAIIAGKKGGLNTNKRKKTTLNDLEPLL